MLRWLRNRKKWQARRKHLIQGRLDMLPLDQAWAEISQKQFADLVSASSGERSNARRFSPVNEPSESRMMRQLADYDQHRLQVEYK